MKSSKNESRSKTREHEEQLKKHAFFKLPLTTKMKSPIISKLSSGLRQTQRFPSCGGFLPNRRNFPPVWQRCTRRRRCAWLLNVAAHNPIFALKRCRSLVNQSTAQIATGGRGRVWNAYVTSNYKRLRL